MRCLYCGKELALLKRLTGGAEFCSEAHRKSYQSEYNDLALSRLLQAKQVADPLPALKGDEKRNATATPAGSGTPSNVVAVPLSVPAGAIPEGSMMAVQAVVVPPGAEKPAVGSTVGTAVQGRSSVAVSSTLGIGPEVAVANADDVQTLPAPPEPQPQEIVAAMWGPLVEQPVAAAPAPIAISPTDAESPAAPVLPGNFKDLQSLARDYNLLWANPVTWTPPISAGAGSLQPQQRGVDVRDFQRGNASPLTPRYPNPEARQSDVGSSRVDLQACKLEYSIVSPK